MASGRHRNGGHSSSRQWPQSYSKRMMWPIIASRRGRCRCRGRPKNCHAARPWEISLWRLDFNGFRCQNLLILPYYGLYGAVFISCPWFGSLRKARKVTTRCHEDVLGPIDSLDAWEGSRKAVGGMLCDIMSYLMYVHTIYHVSCVAAFCLSGACAMAFRDASDSL